MKPIGDIRMIEMIISYGPVVVTNSKINIGANALTFSSVRIACLG